MPTKSKATNKCKGCGKRYKLPGYTDTLINDERNTFCFMCECAAKAAGQWEEVMRDHYKMTHEHAIEIYKEIQEIKLKPQRG